MADKKCVDFLEKVSLLLPSGYLHGIDHHHYKLLPTTSWKALVSIFGGQSLSVLQMIAIETLVDVKTM